MDSDEEKLVAVMDSLSGLKEKQAKYFTKRSRNGNVVQGGEYRRYITRTRSVTVYGRWETTPHLMFQLDV